MDVSVLITLLLSSLQHKIFWFCNFFYGTMEDTLKDKFFWKMSSIQNVISFEPEYLSTYTVLVNWHLAQVNQGIHIHCNWSLKFLIHLLCFISNVYKQNRLLGLVEVLKNISNGLCSLS